MLSNNELIEKFQNGDDKAFDELIQNNLNNVFGFFMKLYKNLKNFRHDSNFSTYLYRINTNTANSWITRNKWKNLLHLDQTPDRGEYDRVNEAEWERKELWDSISKLPKKQRKVVILRLTNSLSFREISNITGMKEGTAKVNFHHALKKLKEDLIDE